MNATCQYPVPQYFIVYNILSSRKMEYIAKSNNPRLFRPAWRKTPSLRIPAFSITRPELGLFTSCPASIRLTPTSLKRNPITAFNASAVIPLPHHLCPMAYVTSTVSVRSLTVGAATVPITSLDAFSTIAQQYLSGLF